jgi:hypothetical protein
VPVIVIVFVIGVDVDNDVADTDKDEPYVYGEVVDTDDKHLEDTVVVVDTCAVDVVAQRSVVAVGVWAQVSAVSKEKHLAVDNNSVHIHNYCFDRYHFQYYCIVLDHSCCAIVLYFLGSCPILDGGLYGLTAVRVSRPKQPWSGNGIVECDVCRSVSIWIYSS